MIDQLTSILETVGSWPYVGPLLHFAALALALLQLTRAAYNVLSFLFASFVRPSKNMADYGKWAIVTGATDGLGKAMATRLAEQGVSVLLISRTQTKLDAVAQEISETYGVETDTLAVDYSDFNEESQKKVKAKVAQLGGELGILINNVGVSYDHAEFYAELPEDRAEQLVTMNCTSTALMTRFVLPGLVEREHGLIINVSSAAARFPNIMYAGYSAAKAYVEQLTAALAKEVAQYGVQVEAHTPMFVVSKLSGFKDKHTSFFIPSPKTYARAALATAGHETLTSPYWPHKLQLGFISNMPDFLRDPYLWKLHLKIRKAAYRRKNAKKE